MYDLTGRVALITGGAQGQGAAEARLFARCGARVVVTDVQRDQGAVAAALDVIRGTAAGPGNLLPGLLDAARCGATVGEIAGALRGVFGEHRETSPL